jgi:aminoglycoside phosphotransferase (APT) family kinase protein
VTPLHTDEIRIDENLVAQLVADQLPELAGDVRRLASMGSSNALFHLGKELVVRVPRQPGGTQTILKEERWLPHLGRSLPVAVPEVVALGRPSGSYPEHWSVVRWLDGEHPVAGAPSQERLARDVAAVVRSLRDLEVPTEAAHDPALRWYRAESLAEIDADISAIAEQCRSLTGLRLDVDAVLETWDEAVAAARGASPSLHWLHGDLLAENMLVRDGRLTAVLDFGGLSVGDPTVDLAVAWELFDEGARDVFRRTLDVDDRTWLVARGWALAIAVMTFPYYWATMPERCAARLAMVQQVLRDAGHN